MLYSLGYLKEGQECECQIARLVAFAKATAWASLPGHSWSYEAVDPGDQYRGIELSIGRPATSK